MNLSSWRAAVALLTTLPAAATGQQRVIIIPARSLSGPTPTMTSPRGLSDNGINEPPCRQRRLEPWRRDVRDKCRAEADRHCSSSPKEGEEGGGDEPLRVLLTNFKGAQRNPTELVTPMESSLLDLSREMDSFFDSVFNPPPSSSSSMERKAQQEDPFDNIFEHMMGFSLRAFDQMAAMNNMNNGVSRNPFPSVEVMEEQSEDKDENEIENKDEIFGATPMTATEYTSYEEGEEGLDWEEAEREDAIPSPPAAVSMESDESSSYDLILGENESEDFEVNSHRVPLPLEPEGEYDDNAVILEPEVAAENVLDFMVASLAQRMSASASTSSREEQEGNSGVEEVGLPSVHDLPSHLFKLGSDLLTEVHTRRRRLMEGDGKEDPRLHAKERLARRLTEYQSDLFFQPEDGTITIYTSSSGFGGSSPPFMMSPFSSTPFIGGMLADAAASTPRAQLGMGSRDLDECMESRYDNGDLDNECHDAVSTFYLAVDNRDMIPPMSPEMKRSLDSFRIEIETFSSKRTAAQEAEVSCKPSLLFWAMMLITIVIMLDHCYNSEEDSDDDQQEENDANEFDYGQLPEDDAENERVFVGVPVQVV